MTSVTFKQKNVLLREKNLFIAQHKHYLERRRGSFEFHFVVYAGLSGMFAGAIASFWQSEGYVAFKIVQMTAHAKIARAAQASVSSFTAPFARRSKRSALWMAVPLLGYTATISAANATYTGGSGLWSDSSKWLSNHRPVDGDVVMISPAPGSVVVQLDISATNVASLTIDATPGNFATLSQSTNVLAINTFLYLGQNAGSNGRVNLSGGILSVGEDVVVAGQGNGSFIESGGSHSIGGALQIAIGSGSGSYALSGGSLTVTGNGESIGTAGVGRFDQSGGTHTISSALYVGFSSAFANTYAMTNGTLTVLGEEFIGNFGNGVFNQSGGTHTISTGLSIGAFAGSQGAVNLSGGSLSTANVFVGGNSGGSGGTGTLIVNGGSLNVSGALKIWNTPGSIVTLSGGTISAGSLDFTGNPSVFQWNSGTLQITGGSGLLIGAGGTFGPSIGVDPGKTLAVTGTLTLGGGSTLMVNGGNLSANNLLNNGALNVVAGTAAAGSINGKGSTTIGGGATLTNLAVGSFNLPGIAVLGNGNVNLPGNDLHTTSFTGNLSIAPSGLVDVGSNYLLVDNTATPFVKVKQYVDAAYNRNIATGFGDNNGRGGITSSVVKANTDFMSVGYYNGALQNPSDPDNVGQILGPNSNSGRPGGTGIPLTQILVRPTLTGDLNGDGAVDAYDIAIFNSFGLFNQPTNLGYQAGDFNGDGIVNAKDVVIFNSAGNFNGGGLLSAKTAKVFARHSGSTAVAELNPSSGTLAFSYDPATGDVHVMYHGFTGFANKPTFNSGTRLLSLIDIASTGGIFALDSTRLAKAATDALSSPTITGNTEINLTAVNGYLPDGTDIGRILAPGLDPVQLANALTLTFNYTGSRNTGGGVAGLIVPEPAGLSLICLGALGLMARRRRGISRACDEKSDTNLQLFLLFS